MYELEKIDILLYFEHYEEAYDQLIKIDKKTEFNHGIYTRFVTKFFNNDSSCEEELSALARHSFENLQRVFTTISDDNLIEYWNTIGGNLNLYYSMALSRFNSATLRTSTYNNLILTKNFQYELKKYSREKSGNTEKIINFFFSLPNVETVRQNLSENDVAVEFFVIYDRPNFRSINKKYGALILHNNDNSPSFVELCPCDSLDIIIYSSSVMESEMYACQFYNINNDEIYKLIWQPLENLIKEGSNVYISGCGSTLFINFDAISNGHKRLNEIYSIHNVLSSSLIDNTRNHNETFFSADLFGDIDYDTPVEKMAEEATTYVHKSEKNTKPHFAIHKGINERGDWNKLKYSLDETNTIEQILKKENIVVKKHLKYKASEEAFKMLSGNSPDIIHISTHGYYYQPYMHSFRSDYSNNYFSNVTNNIMSYNGLLFSGANNAWKNGIYKKDLEDGVLTAQEIISIDLSNTKLVVLSACQTGLGEQSEIDGNSGLLKAFKIAGADKILITLWKVSDEATAYFMERFYQNLVELKLPITAIKRTVHDIQNEMPDPYYWAPFIIVE